MYYNVDKQIIPLFLACTDGFIGNKCTKACPYPSYGQNCKSTCVCKKEYCNVSMGCLQGNKGS